MDLPEGFKVPKFKMFNGTENPKAYLRSYCNQLDLPEGFLYKHFKKIKFKHTPRAENEFADALAAIASMIQHPKSSHIDSLEIILREEHAYCSHTEAEPDGKPRYANIKTYLEKEEYPKNTTRKQKKTIRKMPMGSSQRRRYSTKKMEDLGLLRCVDATEATKLLE
ncbi:uncharacterized protein LOC132042158 [Lycium ferocissimum]|uniref:uncharacterized protein LOC132042158 n=1 Tax=Lycium ferocissimum TaxID=112874 RepID=UPI0028150BEA|nr:uncharacterized protein LOC132042158 [Lycium ferocissimum]